MTAASTSLSLLLRLRESDSGGAWTRFTQLYTPLIFYWGRRAGLETNDAADLVQEVFAVLVEKLPQFRHDGEHSFRGWLRTVTHNKWRDLRRRRVPQPLAPDDPAITLQAGPAESDLLGEAEYRRHVVRRALEIMQTDFAPATWRACWELVVNERPAAEIAAELGLTPNAVYAAKFRVVQRLRVELKGLVD